MITQNDIDKVVAELLSDHPDEESFAWTEVRDLIRSAFIHGSSHEMRQRIKEVEKQLAELRHTDDMQSMI